MVDASALEVVSIADRPDLPRIPGEDVWPEYNRHGDVTSAHWDRMERAYPEFQLLLVDAATDEVLAEAHTMPCRWDATDAGLPSSFDALIAAGVEAAEADGAEAAVAAATALAAMAAEIPGRNQGRGLAEQTLLAMRDLAAAHGLRHVIAAVRPSWKDRYPLAAIERYVGWRRADGTHLDPWIRVHERLGARVGPTIPQSLRVTGTVAEWEAWTGMAFPESGTFTFPGGLAPLEVDVEADRCSYWEPNVWMIHTVPNASAG